MPHSSSIILFECNEIPFRVVDRYISNNPSSHVARIFGKSKQFETVCEDQIELDPWISWPTLHRGVIDERHRIFHLGQSLDHANKCYPPIWQLLVEAGVTVGIMGSLHTSTAPKSLNGYAFYVPDFFSDTQFAHPSRLRPFQAFNLAMTRKSARNVNTGVAWREAVAFLCRYAWGGMSLSTIKSTISELFGEFRAPHLKCRRRAVQSLITLDVFLDEMERTRPRFATMHSNHVAAAMHRFWAATFPADSSGNQMPEEWFSKYKDEIDYSMDVFDQMLGRLVAFVERHPSYRLLVASSLGQSGVKTRVTKGFYTITDLERFMASLGVKRDQWQQRFAMVPCLSVVLQDDIADEFEERLTNIRAGSLGMKKTEREIAPLSFSRIGSSFQLYFYFERYTGPMELQFGNTIVSFTEVGLGFHEHQDDIDCSARHTPFGILTVYDPTKPAIEHSRVTISTLDFAPAVLDFFGVRVPPYMNDADPGILDPQSSILKADFRFEGGGVENPVRRVARHTQVTPARAS